MRFRQQTQRGIATVLAVILLCISGFVTVEPPAQARLTPVRYVPEQLIVKFRPGYPEKQQRAYLAQIKAQPIRELKLINAHLVYVPEEIRPLKSWIHLIRKNKWVKYAQPDYEYQLLMTPNDKLFKTQWGLNNTGQTVSTGKKTGFTGTVDADIDAPEAWQKYRPRRYVTVAVIDTGIASNPDLKQNIWVNSGEDLDQNGVITAKDKNNIDDDGNGYIDDFYGWNFVDNSNVRLRNALYDDNGHGTHVAGIIAARFNNGAGIAGIAGHGHVRLISLRFMGAKGGGSTSNAILAIEYSLNKKAVISNNSWGSNTNDAALEEAIKAYTDAGYLFIAAAGNDAKNIDSNPVYPASYDIDGIVSVASTDYNDNLSSFSNYGATHVDIAAPGSFINSTVGGGYGFKSGTSMAAPMVSGVAAMVWSHDKSVNSGTAMKTRLMNTGRSVNALSGKCVSGKVVNAYSALMNN